jgi:hypothetical protein
MKFLFFNVTSGTLLINAGPALLASMALAVTAGTLSKEVKGFETLVNKGIEILYRYRLIAVIE